MSDRVCEARGRRSGQFFSRSERHEEINRLKSEIKDRTDLRELAPALGIERRHSGWLCPFHLDNNPSFGIWKDGYKCFVPGCDQRGDVFRLVMSQKCLSFLEALDWLGARVGVDVPPLAKGDDRGPTAPKNPTPRPAAPAPRPTVREGPVADPDRRIEIYTTVGNAARLKSPCHYLTNRGISHQTAVAAGVGLVTESYPVITRQLCE